MRPDSTSDLAVAVADPPTSPRRERIRARRAPIGLIIASAATAALFAIPFVYLVFRNLSADAALFSAVASRQTLDPLLRTLWLAVSVSLTATAIGTLLAWITMRTDLPGRTFWRIACPLPLVLPSFVAGAAMLAAYAPGGLLEQLLSPFGVSGLPRIDGYPGAFLVLTSITYPYVYLPVAARLASLPPSLEEAARLLGHRPIPTFRRVVWPQLLPSARAGGLLTFLYVVSDFGVVQLMGFQTLTTRIFTTRLVDTSLSFALGLVLAIVALVIVMSEGRATRDVAMAAGEPARRPMVIPLGRWRPAALLALVGSVGIGLIAPVVVLSWWAYRGLVNEAAGFASAEGITALIEPTWNTVSVSVVAAVVSVAVVLPVAFLTARYRSPFAGPLNAVVVAGFALPGLVIALSMVFLALRVPALSALYQTLPLLLLAYVIHFGAQAYRSAQVGVGAVDERLGEAARTLGAGRLRRLWRVELPLMLPPLAAGGGLVMLSTMKELPATLLAAPLGFDTLATRIWTANEGGFLADAGMASLVLIAVSALLTWLLVIRRADHLR